MNSKISKLEGYSRSHPRNGRDLGAWGYVGQTWGSVGSFEEKSRAPCGSQQVGPASPHPHPSTTVQLECQPRRHALKPLTMTARETAQPLLLQPLAVSEGSIAIPFPP